MNSFDDIIQQKANDHEARVPDGTWDNIINKKRKRRFGFFWLTLGVVLCGLLVIGYYANLKPGKEVTVKVDKVEKVNTVERVNKVNNTDDNQKENVIKKEQEELVDNNTVTNEKNTVANEKVGNNRKVEKVDVVNTVKETKKDVAAANGQIKSSIKLAITGADTKVKNVQNSNKTGIASTGKKDNDNKVIQFATRKKTAGKDKSTTRIKTFAGETTEDADAVNNRKNTNHQNSNQKIAVAPVKKQPNEENKELVTDINNEPAKTSSAKKDEVVDSAQKKAALTIFPNENKKEKSITKKQPRKHAWFIDVAITPVLPIQQYDKNVTFNRTLFSQNSKSAFSGKLTSSSIDPSVAFSASLRRTFNKKLLVGIGLQYLQLKEHIRIDGTETNTKYTVVDRLVNNINGPQLISDTVETVTEGQRKINATNNYNFLSIPVFVQYDFVQNRSWSFGGVAGIFVNIFGNYKNEINKNGSAVLVNTSETITDKNTINLALYGGLRIGRMINKRTELFALPSISLGIGNQNVKNSLVNKKIQQIGLSVGLSYKLK